MQPPVSVIVAAYNAEKYLPRCLDSISAQTFRQFEVVIVDDGSVDRTGEIAEGYASRDPRFKVIHQENQGVASARETGLNHITGEYAIHADADDWMEPDMLERMYENAITTKADLVICDFFITRPGDIIERWDQVIEPLDHFSVLGQVLNQILGTLWNKLMRTSCIRSFDLHFNDGLRVCEDQLFVLKFLFHNVAVSHLGLPLYHYDTSQNPDSFANKGIHAEQRMKVLEILSRYTDTSPFQKYYDNAVLHLAYESILKPELCDDFRKTFGPYRNSIRRAEGLPSHVKTIVLLRLRGISLPINKVKALLKCFVK